MVFKRGLCKNLGNKRVKISRVKVKKVNRIKGVRRVEITITEIRNNDDMSMLLKQRLADIRRRKCQPAIIEENGLLIFRKTNSGRKSIGQIYLEEKYGYDSEE